MLSDTYSISSRSNETKSAPWFPVSAHQKYHSPLLFLAHQQLPGTILLTDYGIPITALLSNLLFLFVLYSRCVFVPDPYFF